MKHFEEVVCADGFTMSVQASETHYCSPRETGAEQYTAVEVGYPNPPEPLIMYLAEEPDRPTMTVYPFVPAQLVALVIAKHGGMVAGTLPPGVALIKAVYE